MVVGVSCAQLRHNSVSLHNRVNSSIRSIGTAASLYIQGFRFTTGTATQVNTLRIAILSLLVRYIVLAQIKRGALEHGYPRVNLFHIERQPFKGTLDYIGNEH